MRFLFDNLSVLIIAAVACMFAWLYGGIVASALVPVIPWLLALLFEIMLCFPQRHSGESTYDARERVWQKLKTDPILWVSLLFFVILIIPFFNKGLCPICDYPAIHYAGENPEPLIPFIPFCVNRIHHMNVVMWYIPSLTALLAVRHALVRRGKRLLLEIIVWNGLALSIIGAIQQITGAEDPLWNKIGEGSAYFFSTFGYPNMGGDYFTTLFGISLGLWRWKIELAKSGNSKNRRDDLKQTGDRAFWRCHLFLIPATIFFFSAMATLSRASIILVSLLAVIFFVHSYISFFAAMPKVKRVKMTALCILAFIVIGVSTMIFIPEDFQKEVKTLNSLEVLNRVTGKGEYHTRVAFEIWKDNFLFGCGGWGYKHFCIPKMTDAELSRMQKIGGINVHNDYLQLLAEHGLIGFGCLVAIVIMLLFPIWKTWKHMMSAVRFLPTKELPPKPVAIFILPAPVFYILVTASASFVHGFGDCIFRSPAIISLFYISLGAAEGFLPYNRHSTSEDK